MTVPPFSYYGGKIRRALADRVRWYISRHDLKPRGVQSQIDRFRAAARRLSTVTIGLDSSRRVAWARYYEARSQIEELEELEELSHRIDLERARARRAILLEYVTAGILTVEQADRISRGRP